MGCMTNLFLKDEEKMSEWPSELDKLVYFPNFPEKLDQLAALAEPEEWDYKNTQTSLHKPILENYLKYTYRRLKDEEKIVIKDDGQGLIFNTGLVTNNQEEIYCLCEPDKRPNAPANWHFTAWVKKSDYQLSKFSHLPDMAHYFDDPSLLVLDARKDIVINVEHIVHENMHRFPEKYKVLGEFTLQTILKGAVDNARIRVKRSYKTAIPHCFNNHVQLLLPLCFDSPEKADLALVVINCGNFYRAATCLTIDMAYNNARQLTRPDRDWLVP